MPRWSGPLLVPIGHWLIHRRAEKKMQARPVPRRIEEFASAVD